MGLGIEVEVAGGHATARVRGEVDIATAGRLRDALDDLIREAHPTVIVDVADVSFMDSSGVGVLVAAARRAGREHVQLVLCQPQPAVDLVLRTLQVDRILPIIDSPGGSLPPNSVSASS